MANWTSDNIPDQTGRVAIITGANTGIGLETAKMLAKKGAQVVLACRNPDKGAAALAQITAEGGKAELLALDLSDLASVEAFSKEVVARFPRLDLLIANAGVMVPPFGRTAQGFELQFGTNHLGHFALAGHLLPLLQKTADSRLVVVYSSAHNFGSIDLDDPNYQHKAYSAERAYAQSKLANVLFVKELSRRLGPSGPRVTAAHPGWTSTDLQRTAPLAQWFNPFLAMPAPQGALPTLRAATDPEAQTGSFWGPHRFFEMTGYPVPGKLARLGHDAELARKLWALSEDLTAVRYPV